MTVNQISARFEKCVMDQNEVCGDQQHIIDATNKA